ncbi:MAG: hypothetical protein ACFBZ8_02315 [Opitutales bacterium]
MTQYGMDHLIVIHSEYAVPDLNPHEIAFIETFVLPERRERWLMKFGNPKIRSRFLTRLADSRDFCPNLLEKIEVTSLQSTSLNDIIKLPKTWSGICYIISQWDAADQKQLPFKDCITMIHGIGLGSVVSIVPGSVCFYEGEMPGDTYLLKRE